jgi:8-oxo-dGTP pyrophosphatase MutT (NUDIX family)
MAAQPSASQARCLRIERCELRVRDWQWPLVQLEAAAIVANWRQRIAEIPQLFDGAVYLMQDHAVDGGALTGTLFRTDFKTLLYWRALSGPPQDSIREAFGSAIIRSADGYLLYGRQGPGQVSSGRIYPPGGIIDDEDVCDGQVDIDASVARELAEETGLAAAGLDRVPGYVLTFVGRKMAIAVEWRSALPAAELRQRILASIESQAQPELDDIIIVRTPADVDEARMPPHAQALARTLLSA